MLRSLVLPEHKLASGTILREVPVAYRSWGRLNQEADNAVVVCHALTASTDAVDWWGPLIGPGRMLDTDRFFVICLSVPGSPYGGVSPLTTNPETGRPYGPEFPLFTVYDVVALHRAALEALGVRHVAFAIGGSLGGMQVLEWGFHGDFVGALVPLSVGGRHSPWCIAWTEAQRQAICADPCWRGGHYAPDAPPAAGLAVARAIAMLSYRTPEAFEARFGRSVMPGDPALFAAASYLRNQGAKLVARFDANCYVSLTRLMNSHDVARGRGSYPDVLSEVRQPAFVVGTDSDVLYPLKEQRELARALPDAEFGVVHSEFGHDAFLIEFEQLDALIQPWIQRHVDQRVERSTPGPCYPTRRPVGRGDGETDFGRVAIARATGGASSWPQSAKPAPSTSQERPLHVLKFGGTSISDARGIANVVQIVRDATSSQRVVVVVSALAGVTDALTHVIEALGHAPTEDSVGSAPVFEPSARREALEQQHEALAVSVLCRASLDGYRTVLRSRLAALADIVRNLTRQSDVDDSYFGACRDAALAMGERLSAPLLAAALRDAGLPATPVDAAGLIRTDARHGAARVDSAATHRAVTQWFADLDDGTVPVVTGFIGSAPNGKTTTLGRGGSDYTAALLAAALGAAALERWTDVDGLYSEDPHRNAAARPLHTLTLEEAQTWNRAGRLGMHSHTLDPLIEAGVPICVRSTRLLGARGTWLLPTGFAHQIAVENASFPDQHPSNP